MTLLAVLVILPLAAVTGWFCWQRGHEFARQFQSASHASVMGTVTHSRVATSKGAKNSTNYHFMVQYAYEVDGRPYVGHRVRYVPESTSHKTATALSQRFPVNSQVQVFYRPNAPTDSLLLPGPRGADLLSLMFLGFFNLFTIAASWFLLVRSRTDDSVVPAFQRGGRTHVTLNAMPPALVGLLLVEGGFLFGNVAGDSGYSPSMTTALGIWAAVIGLGVAGTWVQRARLRSGRLDLILDERTRRLWLPASFGREQQLQVPWSQVVAIQEEPPVGKQGPRLILEFIEPRSGPRREVIAELSNPARAQALRDWLESRLKLQKRPQTSWQSS
jgi:hypothetical protein